MGWADGGSLVAGKLEKLRDEIREYYGLLNELKAGLKVDFPEKPEAMTLYERCRSTGLPLVAGGVLDQPHIWLLEWSVIEQQIAIMESIPGASANAT